MTGPTSTTFYGHGLAPLPACPTDARLPQGVEYDRLETLVGRYRGSVVPASTLDAESAKGPNPTKKDSKTAPGARLAGLDDSKVIPIGEPRFIGYARVSTDEQTTALQLDALQVAGCAVIHEDSASGASRSRPGLVLTFVVPRRNGWV